MKPAFGENGGSNRNRLQNRRHILVQISGIKPISWVANMSTSLSGAAKEPGGSSKKDATVVA